MEFEELMSRTMSRIEPLWGRRPAKTYLSERIPIVIAANDVIDSLTEFIMLLTGDPTSDEFNEAIFNESMGKFKLSRHTFNMPDDKKVRKDLSRLTKPLINSIRNRVFGVNRYPLVDLTIGGSYKFPKWVDPWASARAVS